MQCRCPACGHTTAIPPELADFLVRCDRCATLLRPSFRPGPEPALEIQPVHVGRFQVETSRGSSISELLTPPQVRRFAPRPPAPETPTAAAVVASSVAAGGLSPAQGAATLAGSQAVEAVPPNDDLGALASVLTTRPAPARVRHKRHALLGVTVFGSLLVVALALIGATVAVLKASGLFAARPAEATTPQQPAFVPDNGVPSNPDLFPEVAPARVALKNK